MREPTTAMPSTWAIIDACLQRTGMLEAEFARRSGVSKQVLHLWRKRGLTRLPERAAMEGVARVAEVPYEDVLEAVLLDTGYL